MKSDMVGYSSDTNFVLMNIGLPGAGRRFRDLGVLVSDLSDRLPPGFIRVSVGTREENDMFLDTCMKILEEHESKRLVSASNA